MSLKAIVKKAKIQHLQQNPKITFQNAREFKSNFNLRLYGDQLYPNISKYLTKYISPEISKEEFISSYKNGIVQIKSLQLKEKISIHPQIKIEETFIDDLKINIPDEKENFEIQSPKIGHLTKA